MKLQYVTIIRLQLEEALQSALLSEEFRSRQILYSKFLNGKNKTSEEHL